MDIKEVRGFKKRIKEFLAKFRTCFERADTRHHLSEYVQGQLSDIDAKSVEPIAMHVGVAPRTLQEFMTQGDWDHDGALDILARAINEEQAGEELIAIIDETSDPKKGVKTPGVQRQWCGKIGKTENCLVTVNLSLATDNLHAMVDGELYLPKSWDDDRARCREAGIPDEMLYRPKWQIAFELLDRAGQRGLKFECLLADEGYGSKPKFLEELDKRSQQYVVEVPKTFMAFVRRPRVTSRAYGRRGKNGKARIVRGERKALTVSDILWFSPEGKDQTWTRVLIKETDRGPYVREYVRLSVVMQGSDGKPGKDVHLLVVRDPEKITELKFFISNAAADTPATKLLRYAHSRWKTEQVFQQQKQEIGYDSFEGRRYLGLKRHIVISCISYYIMSRERKRLRSIYPEVTVEQLRTLADTLIRNWAKRVTESLPGLAETLRKMEYYQRRNLAAKTSHAKTTRKRLISQGIDVNSLPRCDMT